MTLKSSGAARHAAGGLWKRWLCRLVVVTVCAYLCAMGLFLLASGHSGRFDASLIRSLAIAVLPLLIVALFALPGRRVGPSVFAACAVPLLHLATC